MNHKGKPVPIFVLNLSDYSPPPAVLRIKCLERRPVRLKSLHPLEDSPNLFSQSR